MSWENGREESGRSKGSGWGISAWMPRSASVSSVLFAEGGHGLAEQGEGDGGAVQRRDDQLVVDEVEVDREDGVAVGWPIGRVVMPRPVRWNGTFHQWLRRVLDVRRILPISCSKRCSVSLVSRHSSSGMGGKSSMASSPFLILLVQSALPVRAPVRPVLPAGGLPPSGRGGPRGVPAGAAQFHDDEVGEVRHVRVRLARRDGSGTAGWGHEHSSRG